MSQGDRILKRLKKGERLTVRGIFIDMNINSPTKRLSELEKQGHPIGKEVVYRNNTHFKEYFLTGQMEIF